MCISPFHSHLFVQFCGFAFVPVLYFFWHSSLAYHMFHRFGDVQVFPYLCCPPEWFKNNFFLLLSSSHQSLTIGLLETISFLSFFVEVCCGHVYYYQLFWPLPAFCQKVLPIASLPFLSAFLHKLSLSESEFLSFNSEMHQQHISLVVFWCYPYPCFAVM